ncbi:MAG: hypothetical protein ACREX8_06585, partial [Gammaproteobacteria bacterium]
KTKELEVQLSLPEKEIGPLAAEAEKAGPGHYVVPAAAFGVTGAWELEITSRVSRFDEYQTTLTVPIKGAQNPPRGGIGCSLWPWPAAPRAGRSRSAGWTSGCSTSLRRC